MNWGKNIGFYSNLPKSKVPSSMALVMFSGFKSGLLSYSKLNPLTGSAVTKPTFFGVICVKLVS